MSGGTKRNGWAWTAKSEAAALALAQGKTYAQIEKEGIAGHTALTKWAKVPEFQARIDEHLDTIVSEARRVLRRNALEAALQIGNMVRQGHPHHSVKLAAAKDVLDRVGLKAPEPTNDNSTTQPATSITIQVAALDYRAAIAVLTPPEAGSVLDSDTPGEGESVIDGETVGQVDDGRRYLAGDGEPGR